MVLAGWWALLEEGHRESRCWESVALQRVGRAGGLGALTVDLHVEGQAGAARRVAGSAAVVATVGCAQGLQLEESALLGELGVGICLERPPTGWQTLISARLGLASPPGGRVMEPVGLAHSPCTGAQLRTLWGNRLLWEGRASSLELRLQACCRGLMLRAGAGASLRSTVLESTASNGPHLRGEHREPQERAPGHTVTRPGSKVQYRQASKVLVQTLASSQWPHHQYEVIII